MRLKIELYILSLWVLFFLLFLNKIEFPICYGENCEFIGVWTLIKTNWIPTFSAIGILYGVYVFRRFKNKILDSGKQGPWEIVEIENISFENLSFLATYIIPLLCFDLDFHLDEGRNALMLVLVLLVIGAIYIKSNLYYTNPSLALLNFRIYQITYKDQGEEKKCTVLSRKPLHEGNKVFARHIDEKIYYVRHE